MAFILRHVVRREDVQTAMMEKSLHAFTVGAWHILEQGNVFRDGWHIGFMCDALEAILPHGHLQNVIFNMPPRHMKSLLTVMWHAWLWGPANLPHLRLLNASFASPLATRDNLKVRAIIASEWYQRRWGHRFQMSASQDAKTRFDNNATGFRYAVGVGGAVLGEGGHLLCIDDAQKQEEALSEAHRSSFKSWLKNTWLTRLNDRATGARVVTGQRLHQQDVVGLLEEMAAEGDAAGVDLRWTRVVIPARFERSRKCVVQLPGRTLEDPRTVEGEVLWPAKVPEEQLRVMEVEYGPFGTAGQLQQRPAPEQGGIFPRGVFARWTVLPTKFSRVFHSWDAAFKKGKTNSYVVGLELGEAAGKLYVLRKVRKRMDWAETKLEVKAFWDSAVATHGRVDAVLVEEKANGAAILSEFERTIPRMVPINPGDDSKEARANAASPYVAQGQVLIPGEWSPLQHKEWEDEFSDFPNAAHDDQVDALSQVVIWWKAQRAPMGPPSALPAPTRESEWGWAPR